MEVSRMGGIILVSARETIISFSSLVRFSSISKAEVEAMQIGLCEACWFNLQNIPVEEGYLFIYFFQLDGLQAYKRLLVLSQMWWRKWLIWAKLCKFPLFMKRKVLIRWLAIRLKKESLVRHWLLITVMFICLWSCLGCFSCFWELFMLVAFQYTSLVLISSF